MTDQLQTMPVKIMRVEDFEKLAQQLCTHPGFYIGGESLILDENHINKKFKELQSNYEALIHQPLKKGDFVNEVERPDAYPSPENSFAQFNEKFAAFAAAQADLVFEGFAEISRSEVSNGSVSIYFPYPLLLIHATIASNNYQARVDTLFDLIYHISKYNETATNNINLTFTKEFLKKVIG